jgi:hypothetical protein
MYYLRTRPAVDAIKFTVDQEMLRKEEAAAKAAKAADEFKFSSFGSPVMSPVAFEKKSMGSFELARAGAASPFEATRSDSPATLRECCLPAFLSCDVAPVAVWLLSRIPLLIWSADLLVDL